MSADLQLGVVIAIVGTVGTLVLLGVVALFGALLRRVFPAGR
jgi:hypothetical protein